MDQKSICLFSKLSFLILIHGTWFLIQVCLTDGYFECKFRIFSFIYFFIISSEPAAVRTNLFVNPSEAKYLCVAIYNGMHNTLTLTPSLFLSNTHTHTHKPIRTIVKTVSFKWTFLFWKLSLFVNEICFNSVERHYDCQIFHPNKIRVYNYG